MTRTVRLASSLLAVAWAGCVAEPQCQVNGDCLAGQQCVSAACVPLVVEEPVDESCEERTACGSADECETGVCENGCCAVTCEDDATCRDDEMCRAGWCRPIGAPCGSNNDCAHNPSTPVCDVETGTCLGCLTEADCDIGELCVENGCQAPAISGCEDSDDCTLDQLPFCYEPAARCVSCLFDSDCDTGEVCDARNNACRTLTVGCGWDGDCVGHPDGRRCRQDHTCVQCLVDDDCPRDRLCLRDNTCTAWPSCGSDADCDGDTPRCRSDDKRCVECTSSAQCGSGKTCRESMCIPSSNGCISDAHCGGSTPVCDTNKRTCVTCVDMDDCDGGRCVNQTSCEACENEIQCLQWNPSRIWCVGGGCRQCVRDDDCSDGWLCEDFACVLDPVDTACPSSGQCLRDYVCVRDEFGLPVCRDNCDPFGSSSQCGSGKACVLAYYAAGLPVGACVPKTPGAKQVGQSCSSAEPCDVDLICLPSGPGAAKCRRRCDPPEASGGCIYPEQCQGSVQSDLRGVPRTIGLCFPQSTLGETCTSDAQCDSGQLCAAGPTTADPYVWANVCKWPAGDKTGGQNCSADDQCRSGLCLAGAPGGGGFCQGACQTHADCPPRLDGVAGVCGSAAIPWVDRRGNPTTVEVASCVLPCREDSECAGGQFCELIPDAAGTGWSTRCSASPYPDGALGGGSCRAGSECRSGTCITFGEQPSGICQGLCSPSSGAAACHFGAVCPPNGVLRPVGPGTDGSLGTADDPEAVAPLCWTKSCTTNADCGHGRVCAADKDPLSPSNIVLSCHPNQGAVEGGGQCTDSADCRSGLCISWTQSLSMCFGACATNADCAVGRCGSWSRISGGATVCLPPS